MFNKRILAFALFLALCLFACGAYADDYVLSKYLIPQDHLQYNPYTHHLVRIAIQPLLGALKPNGSGHLYNVFDGDDIPIIKQHISAYASDLSKNTADNLLRAIGYTGNASVTDNAPVWGNLGGFDYMSQNSSYLMSNGWGFRIKTYAVAFDLQLFNTANNISYSSNQNLTNFSLKNSSEDPYLVLSKDEFPVALSGSFPAPGAILSASIYGLQAGNNNQWDEGSVPPWSVSSLDDWYGSINDHRNAEIYLRLIIPDHSDSYGQLPLQEIISEAKDSAQGFLTAKVQAAPDHFSPYAFVWTEVELLAAPLAAPSVLTPPDVPQTGDSSSLAPWLLLLGGAFALLALRRRSQHAS